MKYLSILLLFAYFYPVYAQDKHDYNWILGGKSTIWYESPWINFNTSPIDIKQVPSMAGMLKGGVVMSDSNGQLLFYSGGCQIAGYEHEILFNGDSINAPKSFFTYDCINNEGELGYSLEQGMVALPYPGHSDWYVLIHLRHPHDDWNPEQLLFTLIDMSANGGKGAVLRKNELLETAPFADCLTAVRHGNGRDWWIVAGEEGDTYHKWLLTPEGMQGPFIQKAGYTTLALWRFNQAAFSPDGLRYARVNGDNGLVLQMYFDRCSGEFSCPVFAELERRPLSGSAEGIAYSPDSKMLYVSFGDLLYQVASDAFQRRARPVLIAEYDGFWGPLPTRFFRMQLAPDGKIYMGTSNGSNYLHVIEEPNKSGPECNFKQHSIFLPGGSIFGLNTFPHYRLYDQPYSRCDTLGIDAPPEAQLSPGWTPPEGLSAYPNPANEWLYIALGACEKGRIRIIDATGRIMYEEKIWYGPRSMEIPVGHWSSGIYFIQVHDRKAFQHTVKVVIQH